MYIYVKYIRKTKLIKVPNIKNNFVEKRRGGTKDEKKKRN